MMWARSLASLSGLRIGIAMSCGVGRRLVSDSTLLWHRLNLYPGNFHMPQVWPSKEKKKKKKAGVSRVWLSDQILSCCFCKVFLKHIHIHSFVISHACFHTTMSIVATNTIWHSKPNTNWPFEKKSGSVLYKMH